MSMQSIIAVAVLCIVFTVLGGIHKLIEEVSTMGICSRLSPERLRFLLAGLWALSAVVIFVPGGVVSQIRSVGDRLQHVLNESPTGYICHMCGRVGTHSQGYGSGTVLYFCDSHWPPPSTVSGTASAGKGMSPTFSLVTVLGFYGINYFRVLVHVITKGRQFEPSLKCALWGAVGSLLLVVWFATRHRDFWTLI